MYIVSPCRLCTATKDDLCNFSTAYQFKSQTQLVATWHQWSPLLGTAATFLLFLSSFSLLFLLICSCLETYGSKTIAKTALKKAGLKSKPPKMLMAGIIDDVCSQTPLDILFNSLTPLLFLSPFY